MNCYPDLAAQNKRVRHQEGAVRNERFVEACLKRIKTAPDAEEGLRRLLGYLGKNLQCSRVYIFEEMDRQHICTILLSPLLAEDNPPPENMEKAMQS